MRLSKSTLVAVGLSLGLLIPLLLLLSCSKPRPERLSSAPSAPALSRDDAARLISSKRGLPSPQTTRIGKQYLADAKAGPRAQTRPFADNACYNDFVHRTGIPDRINPEVTPVLEGYSTKGLITLGTTTTGDPEGCSYSFTTVALTDLGRKYIASETADAYLVRTHTLTLGTITGIRLDDPRKAHVEYTVQNADITPFAEGVGTQSQTASADLALFDDGWRLE